MSLSSPRLPAAALVLLLHGLALRLFWGGELPSPEKDAVATALELRLIASPRAEPLTLLLPAQSLPATPAIDLTNLAHRPDTSPTASPALPIEAGGAVQEAAAAPAMPAPQLLATTETASTEPPRAARRAACAAAVHPPLLRERGVEGLVRLRVWVDEVGHAGEVLLAASSGFRLFDEAAVAQARRCPYEAAWRNGQQVASWVEFPVRFALRPSGVTDEP